MNEIKIEKGKNFYTDVNRVCYTYIRILEDLINERNEWNLYSKMESSILDIKIACLKVLDKYISAETKETAINIDVEEKQFEITTINFSFYLENTVKRFGTLEAYKIGMNFKQALEDLMKRYQYGKYGNKGEE